MENGGLALKARHTSVQGNALGQMRAKKIER